MCCVRREVYERMGVEVGAELPSHAWPGGYPMYYLTKQGNVLCPACATANDDDCDDVVAGDVHWEGEPIMCDECGVEIESAYGPVDED